MEEILLETERDEDWKLYLIIHAFIFTHEIGHYRYYIDENCVSTADKIGKWMLREANHFLDKDKKGSRIVMSLLHEHSLSEEIFCDADAAVVASTIATKTGICFNERNIADIMLSQALVDIIKNIAIIFVDRMQPLEISHTLYCNIIRSFYSFNYLGELLKTIVPENNLEKAGDSSMGEISEEFSFFNNQVESLYNDNLKSVAELFVNREGVQTTREDRIETLELLRKHIPLFYVNGNEYDRYLELDRGKV